MEAFILLAVIFLVLWLYERRKSKKAKQTISNADTYAEEKKAEGDKIYEEKHREALDYYWKKTQSADERVKKAEKKIEELGNEKSQLEEELDALSKEVICAAVSVDAYADLKSDEIKNQLAILKNRQEDLIRSGDALNVSGNDGPRRVVDSQKKQILRCFNSECGTIIGSVTAKNVDSARSKLQRTYDALNKMFAVDGVQLSEQLFSLKLEELSMVYAYMLKIEEEKETKKAIREQMVEEEKVRREIEKEKQKIEKEEAQFSNEVKKLMGVYAES